MMYFLGVQLNLHFEKSISGWAFMKSFSLSKGKLNITDTLFVQLIRCWKSCLLLTHIEHHLLDGATCLSFQFVKAGRFRVYFLSVDLRITCNEGLNFTLHHAIPPMHLIFPFVDRNMNVTPSVVLNRTVCQCPYAVFSVNFLIKLTL